MHETGLERYSAITMIDYILFHQFKHHRNYIKAWIDQHKGGISDEAIKTIKTLGSSQLDMYFGSLSVEEILQQVGALLQQQGITTVGLYQQWVGDSYKLCHLSDGSSFTLRYIDNIKPIHIHPARHVPHTMRAKANSLKGVVVYILVFGKADNIQIDMLNELRKQHLALPPISAKAGIEEIRKVVSIIIVD